MIHLASFLLQPAATQTTQEHIESMDDPKRGKEFMEPIANVFKEQGFTITNHLEGAKREEWTDFTTEDLLLA